MNADMDEDNMEDMVLDYERGHNWRMVFNLTIYR